ncbi:MAG: hypothetical protein AAF747_07775 [Planctomycetota bacterium]
MTFTLPSPRFAFAAKLPSISGGGLAHAEREFQARARDESDVLADLRGVEHASGFPVLALSCTWVPEGRVYRALKDYSLVGGINLVANGEPVGTELDLHALPYVPIWEGLLFNTVFYAVVFWLSVLLVARLRRYRRMTRGWCPICSYDLQHSFGAGCPECGWRRDEAAA